ncbi:hypothetical protein S83_033439, partial [Arachis hypogaea]
MKREREGARDAFSRIRSAVRRRNLCSVVISSRKQQNIDEAAEKLRAKGIEVLALVCHVSNDQQKKDLIQKIAQCASVLLLKTQKKARAGSDLSLTRMRLLKMRKFKELKMMLPWSSKLVRVS